MDSTAVPHNMGDGTPDRDWKVQDTNTLRRSGNSTVLAIPPKLLQEVRWGRGDEIELIASRDDGTITLRRVASGEETEAEEGNEETQTPTAD